MDTQGQQGQFHDQLHRIDRQSYHLERQLQRLIDAYQQEIITLHDLSIRREQIGQRLKGLEQEAFLWASSRGLHEFLNAVESAAAERLVSVKPESELGRWLMWAREHAERRDPIKGLLASLVDRRDTR